MQRDTNPPKRKRIFKNLSTSLEQCKENVDPSEAEIEFPRNERYVETSPSGSLKEQDTNTIASRNEDHELGSQVEKSSTSVITASANETDRFCCEVQEQTVITLAKSYVTRGWATIVKGSQASFIKYNDQTFSCDAEVRIHDQDGHLHRNTFVFGQRVPSKSEVAIKGSKVSTLESVEDLLCLVDQLSLCNGIAHANLWPKYPKSKRSKHAYVCGKTNTVRAIECELLCYGVKCMKCLEVEKTLRVSRHQTSNTVSKFCNNRYLSAQDMKRKAESCYKEKVAAVARTKRLQQKTAELLNGGCEVNEAQNDDFLQLLIKSKDKFPGNSDVDMFLREQVKAASRKSCHGFKWNPQIIRWCLYLHKMSSSTYAALRASKYLRLPSERLLFEFGNYMTSKPGFPVELPNHISEEINKCGEGQFYSLIFDEMKIQEELVYKHSTGEMIGFVHLNECENALMSLINADGTVKQKALATQVLQLTVRGLTCGLHFQYAYFGTNCVTSKQLYGIVMEAIARLEMEGVKILTIVCDGATVNRSLFSMLAHNKDIPFWMENPYAPEENRPIYFISDPCHLIKTVRNSFSASRIPKEGKGLKRLLWKNRQHIVWKTVQQVYNKDIENIPRAIPKLSNAHVYLTASSQQRVSYATQVLSNQMAVYVKHMFGDELSETAQFIAIFNKYFDLHNTRSFTEGKFKRNPNLNPYSSPQDTRLLVIRITIIHILIL